MKKRKDILNYYGVHAVMALFEKRKMAIERVYIKKELVSKFSKFLKWCADQKKPYNIVEDSDLEKLTDSTHHEGICVTAKIKDELSESDFYKIARTQEKSLVLFLNHVENPHNLGAIIRTCAHFNIRYILTDCQIALSPSCCRIAQGGAEFVNLINISSDADCLKQLKSLGFERVATSSHQGTLLHQTKFPPKTLLVMGSETHGVNQTILKEMDKIVTIEGSGHVESLNVSQATALCCYAYFCQNG